MSDLARLEETFRRANPVPDPASPPMSARPAAVALLDLERSGTMQTQQTTTPAPKSPRGRRWFVAAAAFAVVVAAGLGLWAVTSSDDGIDAAATGAPTITFDATTLTCSYSGPAEFPLGVDATFTGVNDSDVPVDIGIVALKPGYTLSDVADAPRNPRFIVIGTDRSIRFPEDAANPTFTRLSIGVIEGTVQDTAGTWLIICGSWPRSGGPEFDHATATFEVVPAG